MKPALKSRSSVLIFCAVLTGCGSGGGGGMTSTAAPNPTPGPSSSPSPTPAPSPTPSPTPTSGGGTGTIGIIPTVNEFSGLSSALRLSERVGTPGGSGPYNPGASVPASALTVKHDLISNLYTLTGERSDGVIVTRTLMPGQSEPNEGGGQSLLQIWPAGLASPVYMADWRETGPEADDRTMFVFGTRTHPDTLPRTGSAGFRIDVRGQIGRARGEGVLDFTGSGSLLVDFDQMRMRAFAPLSFTGSPDASSLTGDLLVSAASAGAHMAAFGGLVQISGSVGQFNGNMNGSLFGLWVDAVGASFSLVEQSLNPGLTHMGVGMFAGSMDDSVEDPNRSIRKLADLSGMTALATVIETAPNLPRSIAAVAFDPTTNRYAVTFERITREVGSSNGVPFTLDADGGGAIFSNVTRDALQPVDGFDAHTAMIGTDQIVHALLLRPDHSRITLNYVSFAGFTSESRQSNVPHLTFPPNWYRSFAYYGSRSIDMPITGSGRYDGAVLAYGLLARQVDASTLFVDHYNVTGTAQMSVDFGARTFTARLDNLVGERAFAMGSNDPAAATRQFDPITHAGTINPNGTFTANRPASYNHFTGAFFGPDAVEFGALFHEAVGTGADPLSWALTGAVGGKRDGAPSP